MRRDHAVQPGRGKLCAFWLSALIGAVHNAPSLSAAAVAAKQLCTFLWSYTGDSVPLSLQAPLLAACESLKDKPHRTQDEVRAAARVRRSRAGGYTERRPLHGALGRPGRAARDCQHPHVAHRH